MNQNELKGYAESIKYGSHDWYLYHSYKNEELAVKLIPVSLFLLIIKGGIVAIIFLWIWWFCCAKENNRKLNNDPYILQQRQASIQYYLSKKR